MTMRTGNWMGAIIAVAGLGAFLGGASEARADHYYSGGFSYGYGYSRPSYTCYSTPVYYAPRPTYYCAPRPVYCEPRPVYYAPRPVYYSQPTYYSRPSYYSGGYYRNSGFSIGGSYDRGYGRDGGSFYFNYRR